MKKEVREPAEALMSVREIDTTRAVFELVNAHDVHPNEVLSDNIYRYNSLTGEIVLASVGVYSARG